MSELELRPARVLVLLQNNEYEIFNTDDVSLKSVVKLFEDANGVAIYRLTDYIRTDSSGEQEVSVRSKKIWPMTG